jgi:hypothetical protein
MNNDILKQQISNGYITEQMIGYAQPQAILPDLRVEPVAGGFIVTGTFPGVGFRRSVCATVPALVKQLRAWSAQFQAPKKKPEES